jgi:hypothetical protein
VGKECGTRGREKCTGFWCESLKEGDHSKDQGVDRRVGSELIFCRLAGGVEWIQLAQNRGLWRAVVNVVMNLRVLASRRGNTLCPHLNTQDISTGGGKIDAQQRLVFLESPRWNF